MRGARLTANVVRACIGHSISGTCIVPGNTASRTFWYMCKERKRLKVLRVREHRNQQIDERDVNKHHVEEHDKDRQGALEPAAQTRHAHDVSAHPASRVELY
eukprot:3432202-Prymnesium_polylepis.2